MNKYRVILPITIYGTCTVEEVEAPNEDAAEERAMEYADQMDLNQMNIHETEYYHDGVNIELTHTPRKPPSIED